MTLQKLKLQKPHSRPTYKAWVFASLLSASMLFCKTPATAQVSDINIGENIGEFRRIEQLLGLKVGVAAAGAGLIGLELWWFLFSKTKAQAARANDGVQSIDITVDGGYSPDQIVVQVGQPVRLNFLRKDPSSCLEQVVLPDYNKAVDLPLNRTATVEIVPKKAGDYTFRCGMNMFRGTLTVKDRED